MIGMAMHQGPKTWTFELFPRANIFLLGSSKLVAKTHYRDEGISMHALPPRPIRRRGLCLEWLCIMVPKSGPSSCFRERADFC
jgi:hypothetical protein